MKKDYLSEYLDTTQKIVIVPKVNSPWKTNSQQYQYEGVIPTIGRHRKIMDDEIIIEFDYPKEQKTELRPETDEYIKKISNFLKKNKINHHIVNCEEGRSAHLRFRIEGLKYHTIEIIPEYKRIVLQQIIKKIGFKHKTIILDDMCTNTSHLCALENKPHYKYNTPFQITEVFEEGRNMRLNKKIIRNIQKEITVQKTITNYEEVTIKEIKTTKLKEFFKENYKEGQRNSLICALAGQCKRIKLKQEESLNLLRSIISNLDDDVSSIVREEEFSATMKKDVDELAVYHYFKKIFTKDYDDFDIETKGKYQEFQLCFMNKELSISSNDLLNADVDDIKYIVEGLMYDEGFMYIAGPPKSFKTYFAIHLAGQLAKGEPVLGRFAVGRPLKVLYIDEENRLRGMKRKYSQMINNPIDNLYFLISPGSKLYPGEDNVIINEIERIKPDVIIFDSLVRFFKGDENNANESKIVYDVVKGYMTKYNLSVIALHHTTKEGRKHKDGSLNSLSMRGSGDLSAQADSILMMNKVNTNTFILNLDMDRYDEPTPTFKMLLSVKDDKFSVSYGGQINNNQQGYDKLNKMLKPAQWYTIDELGDLLELADSTTRIAVRRFVDEKVLRQKLDGKKKVYSLLEGELEIDEL